MNKPLTFLLALTFLFLFSGSSVVFADDWQDAVDAYDRKDYKEAFRLVRPFAEQGYAVAQFKLGVMYERGWGVPRDTKEAFKWNRLAVEQGFAKAQHNLGVMYERGYGVPQDIKEAEKWYRLAAEQGVAEAQHNLGVMYEKGEGVPQDIKEAEKWYRLSAEQGFASAQTNLGLMYERGHGVPQDYVFAHMWWNLAASNGHERAVENRDIVEERMTPSQKERAQQLARNWKPSDRIKIAESPPTITPHPIIPQPPKSSGAIAAGTGFLFGSQDYIITNYHVVKGTSEVQVA